MTKGSKRRYAMATREELIASLRKLTSQSRSMAGEWSQRAVRIQTGVTPLIALGASTDIAITWTTPFRSDSYAVDVSGATGLIGRATVAVKPGTQTAAGLTVTVTATLLVSAGAEFVVIGLC